jgi:transposase
MEMELSMISDRQVRRLFMLVEQEKSLSVSAAKAGMDEKTARKYLKAGQLPSQLKKDQTWSTRKDSFKEVFEEEVPYLGNPAMEAKTVFRYLQEKYPGRFQDGQLRTFQRKVKRWRALEGPGKEVYFPQKHSPGVLSSSDFTHMGEMNIRINGVIFDHLLYHFVLTYSNWETGIVCFSENFESLSQGLQESFWELGGVTRRHRTDNLSAAVYQDLNRKEFTANYASLLRHYRVEGERINAGCGHENGDVEQSHRRFKKALDQALVLRGSRDFLSRKEYEAFLKKIFHQLNAGREERFKEELVHLRRLPLTRLNDFKRFRVKVGPGSTVSLNHNVYSAPSRLIGEWVELRRYSEWIDVWYGEKKVDRFPRLRGEKRHYIQYRHIIEWLVRKPGAFENYRYRDDLFPTSYFRIAYDSLKSQNPIKADKEYLEILYLAAIETETGVNQALRLLLEKGSPIIAETVKLLLEEQKKNQFCVWHQDILVKEVDLVGYDQLLSSFESIRDVGVKLHSQESEHISEEILEFGGMGDMGSMEERHGI